MSGGRPSRRRREEGEAGVARPVAALGRSLAGLLGLPDAPGGALRWGLATILTASLTLVLGSPGLLLACGLLATAVGRARARRLSRNLQLLRELNDAVPLLQLGVAAGLTVRASLAAALPWMGGELAREAGAALLAAERGSSLGDELEALALRLGEVSRVLVVVLVAAERYGAPLAAPLALAADELRRKRRHQLEQAARRLPVRLLFPLALGVLPAFVLLTVVPLVATSLPGLGLPAG